MNADADIPSRPDYFFWRPFLEHGGCVVVSPYRTKYRGGVSPRDALAGANVFALLSRWCEAGKIRLEVRDSLQPGRESENLVLIGSASVSPVVANFLIKLEEAKTPLSFSLSSGYWRDSAQESGEPTNLVPEYVVNVQDLGAQYCIKDFGLVARAPNPNAPDRVVTFVSGVHGYGTLAASYVFCGEEFQKGIEAQLAGKPIGYSFDLETGRDAVVEVLLSAWVNHDASEFLHPIRTLKKVTIALVRVGREITRQSLATPPDEIWTDQAPTPRKSANPHCFSVFFPEERNTALVYLSGLQSTTRFLGNIGFSESECRSYNRRIGTAFEQRTGWREEIRTIGQELERHLKPALNLAPREGPHLPAHEIVYRFSGPKHYLRLPFEVTRIQDDQAYLAEIHPVVRSISGLYCMKKPLSAELAEKLRLQREKLKVLLVASDPLGDLPGVADEIKCVNSILSPFSAWFEVTMLVGRSSTAEAFEAQLGRDYYHIVHYAGHTYWEQHSPQNSFFLLQSRRGEVKKILLGEVQSWLRYGSPLCFWYLSSCEGARTGNADLALQYDFFGFADAFVRVGIPAVLGYRERIEDEDARLIAEKFYRSLCEPPAFDVPRALLEARRTAYRLDRPSWLMPVLIMQH